MTQRTTANSLDRLIEQAHDVEHMPAPQRDLWPGIDHGIARQSPARGRWPWWAAAASLVFAVGVMMAYMSPAQMSQVAPVDQLLSALNAQHQQQRQEVLVHYQTVGWNGQSTYVQQELEQIRASIVEVTAQLTDEPNNQALWQLLQWLYEKELELIESQFVVREQLQQV
ncbi:hypothetical protein [Pseudidiomarina sediminum]|uniref:hypothetical protein n=1 Tax=Pseudidiomarina sediminum TaxID=431675 RepID=UPI001C98C1AF|nr:hypothetical protein [Pseudidiomarina sediminum]MBY6064696.1 hypothetical protein [Pseudidiomarina sediminum]